MNHGLFESLTGAFADGTPLERVPAQQRRIRSIIDHLTRLFNTRAGSLPHMPSYGLPDISPIHRSGRETTSHFRQALIDTIERYEPRLCAVTVSTCEQSRHDGRLTCILTGHIRGIGPVRFQTLFTTTGNASITPWKQPD